MYRELIIRYISARGTQEYYNSNITSTKNTFILLQKLGYNYIIKCNDVFLSRLSPFQKTHTHIIVARTQKEKETIQNKLANDNDFNYIASTKLTLKNLQYFLKSNKKTYSIRNDFTRFFDNDVEKIKYLYDEQKPYFIDDMLKSV